MSRSRVRKRHIKSFWNVIKSTTALEAPPETIFEVPYTDTTGIWNLRATTQFPKSNTRNSNTGGGTGGETGGGTGGGVTSSTPDHAVWSRNSYVSVPATASAGDFAIYVQGIYDDSNAGGVPTGWTQITNTASGGFYSCKVSVGYKVLTSADIGNALSTTGTSNLTAGVFIWSGLGAGAVSTPTVQATTGTPSSQTIAGVSGDSLHIAIKAAARETSTATINGMSGEYTSADIGGGNLTAIRVSVLANQTTTTTISTVDDGYGQVFCSFSVAF